MNKALVFVTTLDGKITHWGDPHVREWTSKEDQYYFDEVWADSCVIVMGSNTFEAELFKAKPNTHLIIMTRNPAKYKAREVAGQLEFTDKSPAQLVDQYAKKGLEQMIVVGGAHIATSFLKAELIDELWLTIEPKIFGTGGNFVIHENLDINLKLISVEKANERGTLLTKYSVIK